MHALASSLVLLVQSATEGGARVGAGRIQGGWGYVWTSYGITWAALVLYGLILWLRHRRPVVSGSDS